MLTNKPRNHNRGGYVNIPKYVWLIIFIMCALAFLTPNAWMTIASILVLPFFATLTWRKRETPILFFALLFQWVAICVKIIHANILSVNLQKMYGGPEISQAFWLSLIGLVVLTAGMRFGMARLRFPLPEELHEEVASFSISKIIGVYLTIGVVSLISAPFIGYRRGYSQILTAFFQFRWVFFFILAYLTVYMQKKRGLLFLITIIEVIIGFTGFFSQFKTPFFLLFIVYLSVGYRLRIRSFLKMLFIAAVLFYLGIAWTAVKEEYRLFLNQGTGRQVVTGTVQERLTQLWKLYTDLEAADLSNGVTKLAERLSGIDMFARVLERVPRVLPHENGKMLQKVFQHVFMPRLFFPNKPVVNDSETTMKYANLDINENTTMSMGYMADMYIDFGPQKMFLPIFFLGVTWGWIYKFFAKHSKSRLFGYALGVVSLIMATQFEANSVKLVGSITLNFLVMAFAQKFVIPRLLVVLRHRTPSRVPNPAAGR